MSGFAVVGIPAPCCLSPVASFLRAFAVEVDFASGFGFSQGPRAKGLI